MQNHQHYMGAPETSITQFLAEFWGLFAGIVSGIVGTFVFYRKYCRGKRKIFVLWLRNAADAPNVLARIQAEMVKQEEFKLLKTSLEGIRQQVERETANRRGLLQYLDKALFEADNNGLVLWANNYYLKMVDRDLPQIINNNWRNSIHDLDREEAFVAWRSAVTLSSDYRRKFRIFTDQGEFWVQAEALCNRDNLGNVLSFAGELRKIDGPHVRTTI